MIGETVSHFRIMSELGKGGMGIVYKAHDTNLDVDRALKFLHPEALQNRAYRQRFLTEARSLAAVQHPNICPIQEIGEENGRIFIAMSFLQGQTLQERLASGFLSIHAAVQITHDVVSGLQKAHSQGVIHRDIKPGNIMLTDDGLAVIMDFGLAKQTDATVMTRTGTVMGTVAYMSPEQARGIAVDHRSDLWSVGVMLYEMLTGRRPFGGENELAMIAAINAEHPAPVSKWRPDVPSQLEEIVERLLEKEPARRYADAGALLAALATIETTAVEDDATIRLDAPRRRPRLQRWQRRRLVRVSIASVTGLGLLLILLYIWPGFLVPVDSISKIAVMPLTEHIEDPDEAYFSQGITDDLIASLTKTRVVTVINQRSAASALERYATQEEIARHLKVHALIEGTVQRIGDRLRMSVQLVQPFTGAVLWADSFEKPQRNARALQDEIALAVAAAIAPDFEPAEGSASGQEIDPEAYALVLKAKYHADRYSQEGVRKSIEYLEAAAALEPEWAEVRARLALAHQNLGLGFAGAADFDAEWEEAQRLIDLALRLDPDCAPAHMAVAFRAEYEWRWSDAIGAFERSIEYDPSLAEAWSEFGWLLSYTTERELALAHSRQAKILDPLAPMVVANTGVVYANVGRTDEAIAAFQESLELEPNFWPSLTCLGQLYLIVGKTDEGLEVLLDIVERGINADESPARVQDLCFLGIAYSKLGRSEDAETMLAECLRLDDMGGFNPANLAFLFHELGQTERAVELILAAYEERSPMLPYSLSSFWSDSYAELYNEPRVAQVVEEIGLGNLSIDAD